jgi:hypothetical protein
MAIDQIVNGSALTREEMAAWWLLQAPETISIAARCFIAQTITIVHSIHAI